MRTIRLKPAETPTRWGSRKSCSNPIFSYAIGAREIYAVPPSSGAHHVRAVPTIIADLHALRDWLPHYGVTTVAMESTGVYWTLLYQIFEAAGIAGCMFAIISMQPANP